MSYLEKYQNSQLPFFGEASALLVTLNSLQKTYLTYFLMIFVKFQII